MGRWGALPTNDKVKANSYIFVVTSYFNMT